jgi:hypothetical protein
MPIIRRATKPKIQIDTEWLLGPDTVGARPQRARAVIPSILAVAVLFAGVGAIALYWEAWSKQVLRWQWERALASDATDDETLATLVSLGHLADKPSIPLIQQLKSTDPNRRSVAFQVLKDQCETTVFRSLNDQQQRDIIEALEQLDPKDSDAILMRAWIAARMMSLIASTPNDRSEWRQRLAPLLAPSENNNVPTLPQTQHPSLLLRTPIESQLTSGQRISTDNRWMPPNELREAPSPPSPSVKQSLGAVREPTRIRIANTSNVQAVSTPRSMSLSDRDEDPPTSTETQPRKIAVSIANHSSHRMTVPIQVKRDRSVIELLRALEQEPDDMVASILEELHSKGFSEPHVELAMALARGTSDDRLAAMDALPNDPTLECMSWLVWMSRSSDQAAKLKAISMLGSTADADAIRYLKHIEQQESDPRVAAHIRQALNATEAAPSRIR